MINKFSLLQSVGQFHQVASGDTLPLKELALIYAENGRGKTTLATIFRSLAANDPVLVNERLRLGSTQPMRVTLSYSPTTTASAGSIDFHMGSWSTAIPNLMIYDDHFVAENVYSGVQVNSDHRENLHDLILGATGVALNTTLQTHVDAVEAHNKNLRDKDSALPAEARHGLAIDKFCALDANPDVVALLSTAHKAVAAARAAAQITKYKDFLDFPFAEFDVASLTSILAATLADIDAQAVATVTAHLNKLGGEGEEWVDTGISLIPNASIGSDHQKCPFCDQNLEPSDLINHYRMYFNAAYDALKQDVSSAIHQITRDHGAAKILSFERAVTAAKQDIDFWKTFTDVPIFEIDTVSLSMLWNNARDAVITLLRAKEASPLEPLVIPPVTLTYIKAFHDAKTAAEQSFVALVGINAELVNVRQQAATADMNKCVSTLNHYLAVQSRQAPKIKPLADDYVAELVAKKATEKLRDDARAALEVYRTTVFPAYQASINRYLTAFNAGFSLGEVTPVNTRAGSTCNYSVLINTVPVSLESSAGAPSFRTVLSAGDRNTLAFAFFLASLDHDPNLANKIVVIDDPMTSLDEHRTLTTAQHIRTLVGQVKQVIVLSHSKPFLFQVWESGRRDVCSAMIISRSSVGSDLLEWNVTNDCVTEHDRRFELVTKYINGLTAPNDKQRVAEALRPMLESFLRVAYASSFPPGTLLGTFLDTCRKGIQQSIPILSAVDLTELDNLRQYSNRFHHDNAAYSATPPNDGELLGFATRVLNFIKRS